jgi:predicted dehydrogenase
MSSIKIGVLGAANIATRSIIPTILKMPDHFEVMAIGSRNPNPKLEGELGVNLIEGYQDVIDFPGLNAVYIPLPTGLHYEWIKKALDKGLHVWSEKSLAESSSEVNELNELAESKGLALLENFQFRFHKQLTDLKRIVFEDKLIGEPRLFRSFFGFPPFSDATNIRYQQELGGGALLDAGAYTLKAATAFLGTNLELVGASMREDANYGVDVGGSAQLYDRELNLDVQVSYGFDNFYQCGIEIWGNKGKLFTNRLYTARAGFAPEAEVQTVDGHITIPLTKDDNFKNIALHFALLCEPNRSDLRAKEYHQNIVQSSLIESLKAHNYAK